MEYWDDPAHSQEFRDLCARLRWFAHRAGVAVEITVRFGDSAVYYACSPEDFPPPPILETAGEEYRYGDL